MHTSVTRQLLLAFSLRTCSLTMFFSATYEFILFRFSIRQLLSTRSVSSVVALQTGFSYQEQRNTTLLMIIAAQRLD